MTRVAAPLPEAAGELRSEARSRAVASLPPEAVAQHADALVALLLDSDWRVRREAALALARAPASQATLDALLDLVTGGDVLARAAAVDALRALGRGATDAVLARLARAEGPARRHLVEALVEGADARCVDTLRRLLDDDDPNVPPAAAEVLGVVPGAAALDALGHAIAHRDPVVRIAALLAFEARGELPEVARVAALVDDPDCGVHAVRALAACPRPEALARVVDAVLSHRRGTSHAAVAACARALREGAAREGLADALRRRTDALGVLCARAQQGVTAQRVAALEALGLAAHPDTADVALRACAAADPEIAAAAEAALERFDPAACPAVLAHARAVGPVAVRAAAAWALRRADPRDADALSSLAWSIVDDGDAPLAAWELAARFAGGAHEAFVARVVAAVERARPDDAVLASVLELTPAAARAGLAEALAARVDATAAGLSLASVLARAGHAFPAAPVRAALAHDDPELRAAALRALACCDDDLDDDVVRAALDDRVAVVQASLADALRAGRASGDSLRAACLDAGVEAAVRAAAVAGLAAREGFSDAVARALDDGSEVVALEALRAASGEGRVEALARATGHASPTVAAEALARLDDVDTAAAARCARALAGSPSTVVRRAASARLALPDDRALLEGLRRDDDGEVRALAAQRLAEADEGA